MIIITNLVIELSDEIEPENEDVAWSKNLNLL